MAGAAQAPDRVPGSKRKPKGAEARVWDLGMKDEQGKDVIFVQGGLSFYEKNDFVEIMSEAVRESMEKGLSIVDIAREIGQAAAGGFDKSTVEGLLRGAATEDEDNRDQMAKVLDTGLSVILNFISTAPRLLEDLHLLALGVPPEDRSRVRPFLRRQPDEVGFEITEVFIEQNTKALQDFFKRWLGLGDKVMTLISPNGNEEPSAS